MRKKEIPAVVFGGDTEQVVWRSPVTDFGVNTSLTVPFSHEAILVQDGQALETFAPGQYVLNEDTTPFFGTLFSEQKVAKNSEVYFVNRTMNLSMRWGTPTQMDLFDPLLKIPVRVGASGELEVRVKNSRKLLFKVGGGRSLTKDELSEFFRGKVSLFLKDDLATAMVENKLSYYEIATKLVELSNSVKAQLEPVLEEYGVSLESFAISSVSIPQEVKSVLEKAYLERARREIAGGGAGFCAKCGANVSAGDVFCAKCGARL